MVEDIIGRLLALGYPAQEGDRAALCRLLEIERGRLLAASGRDILPAPLENAAAERVCGRFLRERLATGRLAGFDFEEAVRAVRLGDTDVSFLQEASPVERFERMLERLCAAGEEELARYRRIVW